MYFLYLKIEKYAYFFLFPLKIASNLTKISIQPSNAFLTLINASISKNHLTTYLSKYPPEFLIKNPSKPNQPYISFSIQKISHPTLFHNKFHIHKSYNLWKISIYYV